MVICQKFIQIFGRIISWNISNTDEDGSLAESYLMRLIRVFGNELHALSVLEWMELDAHADSQVIPDYETDDTRPDPSIVVGKSSVDGATWKQYLAPQDSSMQSRRWKTRCKAHAKQVPIIAIL